jgi:hypothetical protein
MLEALDKVAYGELILSAKTISDVQGGITTILQSAKDSCAASNKTTIIYADKDSFIEITAKWLKHLLPHASASQCFSFIKSYLFKDEAFGSWRRASSIKVTYDAAAETLFEAARSGAVQGLTAFVDSVRNEVSIEFLLATYLSLSASAGEDVAKLALLAEVRNSLKSAMYPLVKKDLEKYLYEIKEIVLAQMHTAQLRQAMGATGAYTFNDFTNFVFDETPMVKSFFNENIWGTFGLGVPSSAGLINFGEISDADVDNFRQFTTIAGTIWEEANFYSCTKSDISKLDLIQYVKQGSLSNAGLTAILDFELSDSSSSGTFYSIDVSTVNNYFVDFILDRYKANDHETISAYSLL